MTGKAVRLRLSENGVMCLTGRLPYKPMPSADELRARGLVRLALFRSSGGLWRLYVRPGGHSGALSDALLAIVDDCYPLLRKGAVGGVALSTVRPEN